MRRGVTGTTMADIKVMMASVQGGEHDVSGSRDLDQLVRAHGPALLRHVRYVYPLVDAPEIVNQTFTVAWRRFDTIPAGAEEVWLRSVVRRVVSNQRRGQRRWRALTDRVANLTPAFDVHPPDSPEQLELQTVVAAIDRLPSADRQVLMIAAVDELSTEDLAGVLEVHPDAAKQRLSRARSRLRKLLAADAPVENEGREL